MQIASFYTPHCGPQFFMRFKLHCVPGQNPVLAFCNAAGQIFFWDLARLTAYRDFLTSLKDPECDKRTLRLPSWLKPIFRRPRPETAAKGRVERESRASTQTSQGRQAARSGSTETNEHAGPGDNGRSRDGLHEYNAETLESWATRYSTEEPQEPLRAHKTESSSANFVGRQAAWSPGGEWCVVVGSDNMTLVLQRWGDKEPPRPTNGVTEC